MSDSTPAAPTPEALRAALKQVIDPEVGLDIVELGLVYDVRVGDARVEADFTMTTPSCPMSAMMVDEVRGVLAAQAPPGTAVVVNLVWDPPWEPSMMSPQAREHFGW